MNDTQPNQNQPISDAFRKFVQCNCCKRHQKNRPLFLDFLCVQKCSANLSDVAKIKRIAALKIYKIDHAHDSSFTWCNK